MREPLAVPAEAFLAREREFDTIIDARSPSEYAHDHIPGAINLPVLNDAEREEVGILNATRSAFEAHRRGAALVSANIARMLEGPLAGHGPEWRPLVYCWRGGNRSGALATVLARVGWRTHVLQGGYKSWRRSMRAAMDAQVASLRFVVLAGRTGCGKSRILARIARLGGQVLDLESLANHRGSVLGLPPGERQPSQKAFDSRLWNAIRSLKPDTAVWVESESRKIGAVQLPEALIARMREAPCVVVEMPRQLRALLLLTDYSHLIAHPDQLKAQLRHLLHLHGQARLDEWVSLIDAGHWPDFVQAILAQHYDPAYDRSMARNYLGKGQGEVVLTPPDGADVDKAIETLARQAVGQDIETMLGRAVGQAPG